VGADRCQVSLDFSQQRVAPFSTPDGTSEYDFLYELCHSHLRERYPDIFRQVVSQMAHELEIIDRAQLCGYFLMVWNIVLEAKSRGIRCQGRGSAANSIVSYVLGITNVDPLRHNLLFERFLSAARFTCPDIDLDFDTSRRDEIIQYVYKRYGREHAAMVCNAVTYQARSALHDIGRALALPEAAIEEIGRGLDTFSSTAAAEQIAEQVPADAPHHHPLRLLSELMRQIDGCPRHLSIHAGGMVISATRLDEMVALEPATMAGRVVMQWDKDATEDAGLIKLDLLGLGMLAAVSDMVTHVEASTGVALDLDALPLDDPAIYEMLCRADTIGAFQVESRAQQQMLPRLKPCRFEDIIVSIAIIRPGPIQGNMVHPYLRRRAGLEPVSYPHPLLETTLRETLGVMLYQEQVLKVAMILAGFTAGEADLLRRALSRSRPGPETEMLRTRFVAGAQKQGVDARQADAIFTLLSGYAGFGFCKSHSASFALIAYWSLWLKCYHPAELYCGLLNNQPMGFYSPEVLLGDARRHGIGILLPDIRRSEWGYSVVYGEQSPALRTGLSAVKGMGEAAYARVTAEPEERPFTGLGDLLQRTGLPKRLVSNLIRAGALDGLGVRRHLLWELGALDERSDVLAMETPIAAATLPKLHDDEATIWEYELLGHSADGQLLRHFRDQLQEDGVLSTWQVKHETKPGARISVGGMVVVRQQPQTAKGILFISLEDESGLLDLVVKPSVYQRLRTVLRHHPLIIAAGIVQRAEGATSLLVQEAIPLPA
jgi:error-prone DNA polymerase